MRNKQRLLAKKRNKIEIKKQNQAFKSTNPFEIHLNKIKHDILGRKITKNEIGKPNLSRSKAFNKRKHTLLNEYKKIDRSGYGLVDQRIKDGNGPDGQTGAVEMRKAKIWEMKNKLNFGDDMLTHKGMQLSEDQMKETFSDLEDEDDELDLLKRGDYVEQAHFGGGDIGEARSAKDFIDEVLDEKRRRQQVKEENIDLTLKLDEEWKDVRTLVNFKNKSQPEEVVQKQDYDLLVKQLMFGDTQKAKVNNEMEKGNDPQAEMEFNNRKNEYFMKQFDCLLEATDVNIIIDYLKDLVKFTKLGNRVYYKVKDTLMDEVNPKRSLLRNLSIFSVALMFPEFHRFIKVKVIELIRNITFNSYREIAVGICICDFAFNLFKNEFVPELNQVLNNFLVLALGKSYMKYFLPEFKGVKLREIDLLVPTEMEECETEQRIEINIKTVFSGEIDFHRSNQMKFSLLISVIKLLTKLVHNYRDLPSFAEIFVNFVELIKSLKEQFAFEVDEINKLYEELTIQKEKVPLVHERLKPPMLTMLEPMIDEPGKKKTDSQVRTSLVRKVKREFKGASRELRKDTQFMKRHWLDETLKNDEIRKRKVKELFGTISMERGLYKKKGKRRK